MATDTTEPEPHEIAEALMLEWLRRVEDADLIGRPEPTGLLNLRDRPD